ncbi:Ltp family lipoprotein [Streptococcus pneumoniae]|uniref:Ltp family lipoprotein n=1 Tax=Streptococcus pneumoniae TaxID=1313 RepID=UPI0005DADAE2|nr:Ltp family lipoprotein [Streptococcus pneumoniae]CIO08827.1 choline binding protein [Streptococcus pneumoniae]CIW42689.1 choline binding protein [Streptococcus pneumoniae]CIX35682.1 choline binding protein [Streptococcus pneumoniae]
MNKRLFLKMSLVTLPILALFSQPVLAEENIHFSSCKEAWANGYSDIHKGEPGYSAKLDRDHDGVACELKNAPKGAFKVKQSTATQINISSATTSGWVKQDGAWYYFDGNGNPVKNAWQGSYYLKADGKMAQSEWVYDSSYQAWYYLKSDGSYAYSTWQGNYYLKSDGKMAKGEWIYDDSYQAWYYLTSDGSYAYSTWQGNYYLKSDGKMAKGEWIYDDSYQAWYYLTSDGSYAYSTWQGNYYLKSDGKMAVNEWVDGGRYYVGADGVWKEGQASTASSSNDSNSEYSAALGKAKSYNSLFHMSKKRMYRQLTSDFDKFSNDVAQYAVDHLEADYKYNALFNAKNYRKLFNMSKSRLINQLTSSIDGFTEEEAQYAIDHLDD